MQIIVNGTDSTEALLVAQAAITHILSLRSDFEKEVNRAVGALSEPRPGQQQAPAPIQQDAAKATGVTEPAPAPEKKTKPKVAKAVSADEVRAVMVAKSAEGKKQQVVALLASMGFDKLSQVPPERLVELKAMVEAL